jgi:catechol 2,3-dioxygenase-like lactoylglutathione lyase family enzyme
MINTQFDHLHLACRDLAASERFYVTHFGAQVIARYSWRDVDSVALTVGDVRVNLKSGLVPGAHPLDHFGIRVVNLAATYEDLERSGADVQREPRHWAPDSVSDAGPDFALGAEFAFIKGPDGEVIELVQRP